MATILFSDKQLNGLFDAVSFIIEDLMEMKKFYSVEELLFPDEAHAKQHKRLVKEMGAEAYEQLGRLNGFQLKFTQKGEHHNDGQLVDYYIDLISPSGKKTKLHQLMCLGNGFDAYESQEVKL